MSVTRDNASPNDTMLEEFEAVVASLPETRRLFLRVSTPSVYGKKSNNSSFTFTILFLHHTLTNQTVPRVKQYVASAVQAALKAIKSNPNEYRHHYQHEANRAILPDHSQTTEAGDATAS
jgi:hypothetical protein